MAAALSTPALAQTGASGGSGGGGHASELPKYAAPDGNIDTDKFICAQFADLPPDDADFLGTWTIDWQNGAAKKRVINVAKVKQAIHNVAVYCKANKDKRFVQAVEAVMKVGH